MNIARAARDQVSHVMQHPRRAAMPIGTMFAVRTRLPSEIAATFDDLRFGQILRVSDAFRGIRQILSGFWHDTALLGNAWQAHKLAELRRRVIITTQ